MSDECEWPDDQEDDGWGDDPDDEVDDGSANKRRRLDPEIQIENAFFEGEANMRDNPMESLTHLENCVNLEEE